MIQALPQIAQVDTVVHFDGSLSYAWNGRVITSYAWGFTDGGVQNNFYTVAFNYTFTNVGEYTVYLTAYSQFNESASTSAVVTVVENAPVNTPPEASIDGWVYESYYYVSYSYWFTGLYSSDDLGIVNYSWAICGNESSVQLSSAQFWYTFESEGAYQIALTVTDYGGLTDSDFFNLTLVSHYLESPIADAGPDQTVQVGEMVIFDGSNSTGSAGIMLYTWLVFDTPLMTYYGIVVNHTFMSAGDFTVVLRVSKTDYGMTAYDDDLLIVHVLAASNVLPEAEAGPDATIPPGTVFQFNASGSTDDKPGLTFLWNFEYNKTHEILYGESPTFRFDRPGKYVVSLTVTDVEGLSDLDTVTITVAEQCRECAPVLIYALLAIGLGVGVVAAVTVIGRARKGV